GDVIGEIDANANAIVYNDNSTNLGVTNVQEAIEKLLQKITEVAGTTGDLSVAGGLEFTSGTNGTTKLLSDAGIQIADKGVTSEKLNAGTGDADRVGVADKDGNVVYKTLDEVVKSNETVTLLVPNANGTFTYYNEKQIGADGQPKAGETGVTIDPKEVSVALNTTSNKYEFKNSKGDVIGEIDANANAITFNNTTNGFTSTNVQDALEELKNTINTNKGNLSVAGGLEFTGGTNGTTKLLSDAGIQIADKGVTSEKLGAKPEEQGKVATVNSDGSVSYKAIKVTDITEGKVMSSTSITIDQGGLGATLKDVSLEIKPGNAGQVMITGTDGKTTWVDQSVISPTTTNSLTSDKNLMTSDVNGVAKTANIINSVENTLDANNNMVTKVNGIASNPLDLTTAVQQGQKNTYVEQGTGITVSKTVSADGKETTYTVASNPSEITLNGDVTGTASTSVVEAIQGTKVSNVKPDSEGQALVYDAKLGLWKPGIPKVDVTDITDKKNLTAANGLDATIEVVTGGANAVLVETSLKVKEESITTKEIKNGTIKPEDIAKAGNNQVLVTNGSGIPTWSDQSDLGKVITSDNGLTKTDNNIQLGGILTKATVITTVSNNTLALEGLDKTKTQAVSKTDGITQHLLAVDKNGDIIKALKAAMPKFFYMPSVLVPTAESQVTQTGVSYNNATRTGSINLYSIYQSQFGTPIKSSVGATPLPVLPVSELGFHITYATEGVFTIESITAEGLMTYKVSSTANVNGGSFINIVFSVKEDN
uniref:hypothetical protein n=1 Tax=Myroides sp. N17-2 TaxID=2030799 RepID=UPI000EFBE6F8